MEHLLRTLGGCLAKIDQGHFISFYMTDTDTRREVNMKQRQCHSNNVYAEKCISPFLETLAPPGT